MFGHGKKKAAAEMMAPQWMKILVESRDIVNRTTDPDVFFSRYDTVKETAEKLASISKYVKFKGTKPPEVLRMDVDQEQAAVRDLQQFITGHFYTCTPEILAGLGEMYTADERFHRNIDKAGGDGTAEFVAKAIRAYCGE